jgi:hypothetical protein
LQKECAKLRSDVARLQSQMRAAESETDLKTEISELRFDKEALESKLRKFATHCQRLEDDKAGMAEALKSCNVDIEAYGSDISEAIVHLCDRLTSVEEAHSKSLLGKSAGMQNSLANENSDLRQKLDKVMNSENRLAEKLKISTKEVEELKKAMALQNLAPSVASAETSNKLRYLEQENLQLMVDIKATKKQLQAVREELESIRVNAAEHTRTRTAHFGDVDIQVNSGRISGIASLGELDAETSDTIELTDLAKVCAGTKAPSLTKSPGHQKRKVLSDNTNRLARTESTVVRTEKRQRQVEAPISTLKVERRRVKTTATPGLGESSSLESDSTGECKQS